MIAKIRLYTYVGFRVLVVAYAVFLFSWLETVFRTRQFSIDMGMLVFPVVIVAYLAFFEIYRFTQKLTNR